MIGVARWLRVQPFRHPDHHVGVTWLERAATAARQTAADLDG
jgi:hypothetical protein